MKVGEYMPIGSIKPGDKLEISSQLVDSQARTYVSQVEHVMDPYTFTAYAPLAYGKPVKLPTDQTYSFMFVRDKYMDKYSALITHYFKEDGFNMMGVKLTSEGERLQRREFFRFYCLLPMKFCKLVNPLDEFGVQPEMSEGIIKDISGGGIKCVSNLELSANDRIKGIIVINKDYVIIMGRIVEVMHFPKSNYKYQYRVEFIGLLPEDQEKIVQYIFKEQIKMNAARSAQ